MTTHLGHALSFRMTVSYSTKVETNFLSCSADLCTDGIIDCNDEPVSDKRGALDRNKRHLSAVVQRDPTGVTAAAGTSSTFPARAMSDMGIERVLRHDSLS